MDHQRNCLSNWFQRLQAAAVPVPRTEIVHTALPLWKYFGDGGTSLDALQAFFDELTAAVQRIGTPCFLRTGQGSGKHQWKDCCYLADVADLKSHVAALVEWSASAGFLGLPCDVWCVREMLPVEPVAVLDKYGDMPLVPELRFFIRDGQVICKHHYWPAGAICKGFSIEPDNIGEIIEDSRDVYTADGGSALSLAIHVAKAFRGDGAWSVDVLLTKRGFYVTDMADAGESFHWPGCVHEKEFAK